MKNPVDLHQLLDWIGDAVIVFDASEKIALWNATPTCIFGCAETKALCNTLNDRS
jgi:hypothetical protein